MKILAISHSFSPKTSARAIQSTKLICGLAACGHEIEVVAEGHALPASSVVGNRESHASQPDFAVIRVPLSEGAGDSPSRISGLLNRLAAATLVRAAFHDPLTREWIGRALERANQRLSMFRPELVLTLSNPMESHAVGLVLKQQMASSIPWVAFFSDPRPISLLPRPYAPPLNSCSWLLRRHQNALVRDVLSLADRVVVPNQYQAQLMASIPGASIREKTEVIPHIGSAGVGPADTVYPMTLAHIGNVTKERSCVALLAAIRQLAERRESPVPKLLFLGHVCKETHAVIRRMRIEPFVKFHAPVTFEDSIALMRRQHVLLLIEAPMTESPFLPSKFADYVASNRPIIAITPPRSAVRDHLSEMHNTWAVGHNSEEIEHAIRQAFALPSGTPRQEPCCESKTPFTIEAITRRYSELFARVRAA